MDEKIDKLRESINRRIIGKESLIDELMVALFSGGHVLLEDVPGVGKTSIAKALSESFDLSFKRIQLTPDTLPGDITGSSIFDRNTGTFKTVLGPVNAQIVLADELNRTGPKTQAALLEAMEEKQVTIDGTTFPLPDPFFVIATQNPLGAMGTYPLPEAELDRFMMKRSVGYPEREDADILCRNYISGTLSLELEPVMNADDIIRIREEVKTVTVSDELIHYANSIIEGTRKDKEVMCGASPRASLDLLRASQAKAYMAGRSYVIPEDIYDMSLSVLPHRIVLSSEARMNRRTGESVVKQALNNTSVPK